MSVADVVDGVVVVVVADDHIDETLGRDLRQDHGDLYQAPLQAVLLCVRTVWRTLL